VKVFYQAVRGFYYTAAEYALANLPLTDEVLQNASFVNFEKQEIALFFPGGILCQKVYIMYILCVGKLWVGCYVLLPHNIPGTHPCYLLTLLLI